MNKISLYSLNIVVFFVIVYLEVCPLSDVIKMTWELDFSIAYFLCTTVSFSSLKWSFILLNFYNLELGSCRALVFWTLAQRILLFISDNGIFTINKKTRRRIFSILIFISGNFIMHLILAVNLAYHEILRLAENYHYFNFNTKILWCTTKRYLTL